MRNTWLEKKVIASLLETGQGVCPFCGSADVDYTYTRYQLSQGALDVWCATCKRAFHSPAIVPLDTQYKLGCAIPEDTVIAYS